MAERNGLLNRRTGNTVPGVRIPPSPPYLSSNRPAEKLVFPFLPQNAVAVFDNKKALGFRLGAGMDWPFHP